MIHFKARNASKEVPVAAWRKRPDNEIVDPTGAEATSWVDVSIRALVQESMLPLETLLQHAVRDKRRECPVKDAEGRHVVQGDFVPFVMSNMGSLDPAAHKFLRKLRKKDPKRTEHLMDVLVVQHAKWIARRLRRSLGFYNQPVGQRPAQPKQQFSPAKTPLRGRLQKLHEGLRVPPSNPAAAASSQSGRGGKTAARAARGTVGCQSKLDVAANVDQADSPGAELSQHFEQELDADADARADYQYVRDRSAPFGLRRVDEDGDDRPDVADGARTAASAAAPGEPGRRQLLSAIAAAASRSSSTGKAATEAAEGTAGARVSNSPAELREDEQSVSNEAKSHGPSSSPHLSAVIVMETALLSNARIFSTSGEGPLQWEELAEVRQQTVLPISLSDVHPVAQDGQPVDG